VGDQVKVDEMDRECSMYAEREMHAGVGGKSCRKEVTWKTQVQIGGC
jgi:hypothetical protein